MASPNPKCQPLCRHPQGGFTLIEVLVALAVLAVGLVALLQSFGSSLYTAQMMADQRVAAAFVNSQLAELTRQGAGAVRPDQGQARDLNLPEARYRIEVGGAQPLPGVPVTRVVYTLEWQHGEQSRQYEAIRLLPPAAATP